MKKFLKVEDQVKVIDWLCKHRDELLDSRPAWVEVLERLKKDLKTIDYYESASNIRRLADACGIRYVTRRTHISNIPKLRELQASAGILAEQIIEVKKAFDLHVPPILKAMAEWNQGNGETD